MPGHVKMGKAGEPDPDPTEYLVISMDMKRADMLKPYDPKKSYWCPDGNGNFKEGLLVSDEGGKATCMLGHEVREVTFFKNRTYPLRNMRFHIIPEKSVQE